MVETNGESWNSAYLQLSMSEGRSRSIMHLKAMQWLSVEHALAAGRGVCRIKEYSITDGSKSPSSESFSRAPTDVKEANLSTVILIMPALRTPSAVQLRPEVTH
ncbi:hypothetical protein PTI98_010951 [Pleurotus ostreatus]|nr:hypothetical protein PTI98_010951 [Pleurotus ostreatus]